MRSSPSLGRMAKSSGPLIWAEFWTIGPPASPSIAPATSGSPDTTTPPISRWSTPIQSTLKPARTKPSSRNFHPTGSKLLYSTSLGSSATAAGIAVDSADNAYVAVNADSGAGFPGIQNGPAQSGIVVTNWLPRARWSIRIFIRTAPPLQSRSIPAGNIYVAGCSARSPRSSSARR